jgi:hypothetical protein
MKKQKETRGRKSLLNAALTKRICKLLAQGSAIKSACIICGIGERTYHDWNERGQKGEQPFARFFSAATRARETHKANLIKVVLAASAKDARHAEWLLERQFPDEFGRPEPRTIIIQQNPTPQMPPPVIETTHEWHKDADVPPELTRYLGLLQRTASMSTRKKMSANSNGEGDK